MEDKTRPDWRKLTKIMCRVQNQSKAGTALCTFFLFNIYQFVILHKYRKKEKQKAGGNKQTKTQN